MAEKRTQRQHDTCLPLRSDKGYPEPRPEDRFIGDRMGGGPRNDDREIVERLKRGEPDPPDKGYPEPREDAAETIARAFHEFYETLAPDFSYETREASAKLWADVPENNRKLMIHTVICLLNSDVIAPASKLTQAEEEAEQLRRARDAHARLENQFLRERDEAQERLRDLGARNPAEFIRDGRCVVCGEGARPGELDDPNWHTMPCIIRRLLVAEQAEAHLHAVVKERDEWETAAKETAVRGASNAAWKGEAWESLRAIRDITTSDEIAAIVDGLIGEEERDE